MSFPHSEGNAGRSPRGDSKKRGNSFRLSLDKKSQTGDCARVQTCRIVAGADTTEEITESKDVVDAVKEFVMAFERRGGLCCLHDGKGVGLPFPVDGELESRTKSTATALGHPP